MLHFPLCKYNNYFLHQAFTFGSEELEGFWVAKFEPSIETVNDVDRIRVVPNVSPVVLKNVSEFFDLGLGMIGYICGEQCDDGTDTHMMKNKEWGAVAYLSRSQYGNSQEIWNNAYYSDFYEFKTGCAGSKVDAISETSCVNWNTENGQRASTTGNVYGVYDMKGGAYEYVMGNLAKTPGSSGLNPSGVDSKYIDVYDKVSPESAQNNYEATINRYGDAIWETSSSGSGENNSWHGAYSMFIFSSNPWLVRGGHASGSAPGIFYFKHYSGNSNNSYSFRPIAILP